ncbi:MULTISPECIES: M23 family metallopeptidase [Bacillus]|uniref:M23 family metallopeptidase n=1 Tax=Bacillus TaxID=1386 RepID=UPI00030C1E5D|nr:MULTISPECIES: M23 family metallopeptidase [Bacillus]
MTLSIIQLMVFQWILPAVFIISLWRGTFQSKIDWGVQAMFTVLFTTWLFLSSQWDWFSYYIRFIWLIFLLLAIYKSWKRVRTLPFYIKFNRSLGWSLGIHGFLLLIFGMYNVLIFSGYTTKDDAIELDFPLENGTYYVGQGGNNVQINYHNAYPNQRYALDIVKLNQFGIRAAGIYPKELDKYVIFGDELYSPCTGKVLEARDNLSDLTPPDTDIENVEGNYVKINCKAADVYIAHMQEGSVKVKEGQSVQKGQQIGLVGNSGNTSEPHLHIHAENNGEGVPIRFNGRFLVKNSLVW